jgi:hypothetical protein
MRKIILLALVIFVPFMTIAQKRSKKNKKTDNMSSSYEFMTVTGYQTMQIDIKAEDNGKAPSPATKIKHLIKSASKVTIAFDFGKILTDETTRFQKLAPRYRSMAEAVNALAVNGWEFQSANVLPVGESSRIYYYYMKRNK